MLERLSHSDTELLAATFPAEELERERAFLAALPPSRYDLVIARLRAVVAAERGGHVGRLAEGMGLDRPAFFRLRQRWRASRSTRSLTPFATRAPRQVGVGKVPDAHARALRVIRSAPAEASAASMVRLLVDDVGGTLSYGQALAIVRQAKLKLAIDREQLSRKFGLALIVDISAVSLLAVDHDAVAPIVVAVVLDRTSRLIFGHAIGLASGARDLQVEALRNAADFLDVFQAVEGAERREAATLEIILAEPLQDGSRDVAHELRAAGFAVADRGERRFGRELLSLLGHRLGRVFLRPRLTSAAAAARTQMSEPSHSPLPLSEAIALADEAVHSHNRARSADLFKRMQADLIVNCLPTRPARDSRVMFVDLVGRWTGAYPDLSSARSLVLRATEVMLGV